MTVPIVDNILYVHPVIDILFLPSYISIIVVAPVYEPVIAFPSISTDALNESLVKVIVTALLPGSPLGLLDTEIFLVNVTPPYVAVRGIIIASKYVGDNDVNV